jgi:hypothetical protein
MPVRHKVGFAVLLARRHLNANELIEKQAVLLHRTLVANGTKRHFVAAQQTVAIGSKADITPGHRNGRF